MLVGLGNPGSKYKNTRHNLGFMIVEKIARVLQCKYKLKHDLYCIAKTHAISKNVLLAKPLTYMNRSGTAVSELVEKYEIPLKNLLIILDDFNLPFGKIRLRSKGSDGGHNGLDSIISEMSTNVFPRLRVGIGKENISDQVDFVLSNFDDEEREILPEILESTYKASMQFINDGIDKTMSSIN